MSAENLKFLNPHYEGDYSQDLGPSEKCKLDSAKSNLLLISDESFRRYDKQKKLKFIMENNLKYSGTVIDKKAS